jgi:hypothetical protein
MMMIIFYFEDENILLNFPLILKEKKKPREIFFERVELLMVYENEKENLIFYI